MICELADELLVHILSYLSFDDRKLWRLVCKRWHQVSYSHSLIKNDWLVVPSVPDLKKLEDMPDHCKFVNVRISSVGHKYEESTFWLRFGTKVSKVELISASMTNAVIVDVLKSCVNLRSFALIRSDRRDVNTDSFAKFAPFLLPKLESLKLKGTQDLSDKEFKVLTENAINLTEFYLERYFFGKISVSDSDDDDYDRREMNFYDYVDDDDDDSESFSDSENDNDGVKFCSNEMNEGSSVTKKESCSNEDDSIMKNGSCSNDVNEDDNITKKQSCFKENNKSCSNEDSDLFKNESCDDENEDSDLFKKESCDGKNEDSDLFKKESCDDENEDSDLFQKESCDDENEDSNLFKRESCDGKNEDSDLFKKESCDDENEDSDLNEAGSNHANDDSDSMENQLFSNDDEDSDETFPSDENDDSDSKSISDYESLKVSSVVDLIKRQSTRLTHLGLIRTNFPGESLIELLSSMGKQLRCLKIPIPLAETFKRTCVQAISERCPDLESIDITLSKLGRNNFTALFSSLPKLKEVRMFQVGTDMCNAIEVLSNLDFLTKIDLGCCSFTHQSILNLSDRLMPNIQVLIMNETEVRDDVILKISPMVPNITEWSLNYTRLGDIGLRVIVKNNKLLRFLSVTGCINLTSVIPDINKLTELRILDLSDCRTIKKSSFARLNLRYLKKLYLNCLAKPVYGDLKTIIEACPSLEHVYVDGFPDFKIVGLRPMIHYNGVR